MSQQTTKIILEEGATPESAERRKAVRLGEVLWSRYEVVGAMGAGNLGELWRCRDLETEKTVTLRQLPAALRMSKPVLASIHAGIRRLSEEEHPNVGAIRQLVYIGEEIFLLGDYAPGTTVAEWGRGGDGGRRTLEEALPVLRQVASALDFAHGKGIVHRNLKSANVFIDEAGGVKACDFGLAPHGHMTLMNGEAVRTGTSGAYLAPEVEGGGAPDPASDQYALGVLAWEMLSGGAPGPDGVDLPEELPATARAALRRALSEKPRKRFASCGDFVRALGGERVAGKRGRSAEEWRRIWMRTGLAAGIGLAASGLGFAGWKLADWLDADELGEPAGDEVAAAATAAAAPAAPPAWRPPEPIRATTPMPTPGSAWVASTVPMEFIWVPTLGIWAGRYEVTNGEYRQKDPDHNSGEANGLCLNGERQPAARVNFDECIAYGEWLTRREREAGKLPEDMRYRLPSRFEAIAYTRAGFATTYPWGETWPPARGNYADAAYGKAFAGKPHVAEHNDGFAATAPVERSGENAFGLYGAGGNVWETTTREPGGPQFGGWQGGGWEDFQPTRLQSDALYGFVGNARGAVNGFRLVLAPVSTEAAAGAAAPANP